MRLLKPIVIGIALCVALALVVQFAAPVIRGYVPTAAHAWLSNFGGGLLIAVVVTTLIARRRTSGETRLWTPVRLTVALMGLMLLLMFQPDVQCRVTLGSRSSPVVCD